MDRWEDRCWEEKFWDHWSENAEEEEDEGESYVPEMDLGWAEDDIAEDSRYVFRITPACPSDAPEPWCTFSETLPF